MRSLAWVAAHVAAMVVVHVVAMRVGDSAGHWLLYAIPLAVGAVQWAFLWRDLGWWGVLWPPACVLGVCISFLGIWWFPLVIGAGVGIAQAPILAVSGFRRWWAWVAGSGLGWFIGMMLGSVAENRLGDMVDGDGARMTVLYAVTALVYGGLTAAALHVMPRAGSSAAVGGDGSGEPDPP